MANFISKYFLNIIIILGIIILLALISYIVLYTYTDVLLCDDFKMPGVRCPNCLKRGIETWVLPGKHCPKCSTPC